MFSKKTHNKIILKLLIIFIAICLAPLKASSNSSLQDVSNYFNNLNEFSSTFLQIQNNEVSEGKIYFKEKRLRVEYTSPSQIIFILKKNKAMYYNKDLKEVEYFNPKDTFGQFFIDLFINKSFLKNSKIDHGIGFFNILKTINFNDTEHEIKIYFEKKPFRLRKFVIKNDVGLTSFTIMNPDYNPSLDKSFFSLANPLLKQ